eukprot:6180735-Pleurochrysis_carterae.AAC.3
MAVLCSQRRRRCASGGDGGDALRAAATRRCAGGGDGDALSKKMAESNSMPLTWEDTDAGVKDSLHSSERAIVGVIRSGEDLVVG